MPAKHAFDRRPRHRGGMSSITARAGTTDAVSGAANFPEPRMRGDSRRRDTSRGVGGRRPRGIRNTTGKSAAITSVRYSAH